MAHEYMEFNFTPRFLHFKLLLGKGRLVCIKLQANYYILKVLRHVKKMSVKVSFEKQATN